MRRFCTNTFLSFTLGIALPAQASRVLEEVLVTAQKKEQSLQDVPISVSTIGGELVKDAAISDVQDMVQYTPNVKFASSNANPVVSIRGFGTGAAGRGLESPVGIVIDDVYYGRATYVNDGTFDLERLEVLRGPQGALFGKNTIAGVLNFTTRAPSWETGGDASLQFTSLDGVKFEGGLSLPIIEDTLAARLSLRGYRRDTGLNNTFDDRDESQEDLSARLKLLWQASDSLELLLNLWHSSKDRNAVNRPIILATDQALEEYRTHDPDAEDDPFDEQASHSEPGYRKRRTKAASLKTVWSPAWDSVQAPAFTAVLSYAETEIPFRFDADYSPIDLLVVDTSGPELADQLALELRFDGGWSAPFNWGNSIDTTIGLFVQQSSFAVTQLLTVNVSNFPDYIQAGALGFPGTPAAAVLNTTDFSALAGDQMEQVDAVTVTETDSLALFGQAVWQLNEAWDLTLGLRIGRETKDGYVFSEARGDTNIAAQILEQEDFERELQRREKELSPKIALSWQPNDEWTLFANASKGFKSGGFQTTALNPNNLEYDAEEAVSVELGVKARLLEGSLSVNATLFQTDFDNLQVIDFDGTNFITRNAAEARSRGFELDFVWLPPWEPLTIAGSVGLTDAKYTSYPCAPAAFAGNGEEDPSCDPTNSDANPFNDGTGPDTQDLSGRTLAYNPKRTASLMPSLRFPVAEERYLLIVGLDLLYQGDYFLEADLDSNSFRPATTKLNARLGFADINDRWRVTFNAKNLTEVQEIGSMADQPILPGNYVGYAEYDETQYILDLQYRFGDD